MVNDIGATEIQLQAHGQWWKDDQETSQPRAAYKLVADPVTHNGCVMQGSADSYITIIGHRGQKEKLC